MNYLPVEKVISQRPVSFILRHAERYSFKDRMNPVEARLTDRGMSDAYDLGRDLKDLTPAVLYHSPVPRCRQTAEKILDGMCPDKKDGVLGGFLSDLGGPYILGPWPDIAALQNEAGVSCFLRKWFDGDISDDLLMPVDQVAGRLVRLLADQLDTDEGVIINVTHDWNLMTILEYFFGLKHEDIGTPDFLDGLAAARFENRLILYYHEYVKELALPL